MKYTKEIEKTVATGFGYRVYYNYEYKLYFVDYGKTIIHSYETLQGVAETLYYNGYIPVKDVAALDAMPI